ncbi:guanine nucleotide-binding protein-like 3 [Polyodon spathula]|uniref:guanine nucleotide-binding protein-like 3 n=1 Tax=Polyodon spathula TaxID=7913 RepID=UPI001B7EB73A|nr:guanine nucleotide-binding protein-like 3 [Polyodon spathula]
MKRPKLKKASKRVTCSKRYKIQKKVREHNKKLRKAAKKQKIRKVKKDPGIPNAAPFKEELLREAEHRKLQLEELKEKQKLAKQKQRAKKRELEAEKKDPATKAKKAKKEQTVKKQLKSTSNKDKNSKTLFCSELKKVIEASDVILEVLDARDPLGCRCPQLEETILNFEGKKKLILVLNKTDLVPKDNVEKWLKYLQNEFPTVVFKASTQLQDKTMQEKKRRAASGVVDLTKGVTCLGSDVLLQLLGDYYRSRGTDDAIKVGVVGFPNVGKSSLINSMKKVRACHVGISRCTTRCMQLVHIDKSVKMLDSPCIIAGSLNSAVSLALRSASEMEKLGDLLEAVHALLKHCNKQQVMLQYNVPNYKNSLEFLTLFAMKRGYLKKGGVPDTQKAAETLLNDWTGAKVSYHSKPPEQHTFPSRLSETDVAERLKEWEMEKLKQGNLNTIKNVKCPNMASSIVFHSSGPTDGVLEEGEVKEPDEWQDEEVELGSEEEDEDEEELELDEIKPKVEKVLPVDKASNGKLEEKTTGEHSRLQSQVVPVSIDFSSSKKDDDAYDFNTDFN